MRDPGQVKRVKGWGGEGLKPLGSAAGVRKRQLFNNPERSHERAGKHYSVDSADAIDAR
jgi:hypothetical protein